MSHLVWQFILCRKTSPAEKFCWFFQLFRQQGALRNDTLWQAVVLNSILQSRRLSEKFCCQAVLWIFHEFPQTNIALQNFARKFFCNRAELLYHRVFAFNFFCYITMKDSTTGTIRYTANQIQLLFFTARSTVFTATSPEKNAICQNFALNFFATVQSYFIAEFFL